MTFVLQLWLFGTPVLYTLDIIPAQWRLAATRSTRWSAMIAGFRAAVLGGAVSARRDPHLDRRGLVLFAVGVRYFLQVERRFADVI